MNPVIAVIAPGVMGAAVGARLVEHAADVITSLDGRSATSAERAKKAGLRSVDDSRVAEAGIILSIVPPAEALPLAERLAPALAAARKKPVYIDCNAINPDSARRVADVIGATGCGFIDGGIIGGPPRAGDKGPVFYLSGADAPHAQILAERGLRIAILDAPVGAASALKMSYGGITKGLVALGAAMALGAERAGVGDALRAEIAASRPDLVPFLKRGVPDMFSKAYRFVAEMEEIATFLGERPEADIFTGAAGLYERLADGSAETAEEIAALAGFFGSLGD